MSVAYSANEDERRITLVKDMLIQIRCPVVPDRNVWKKRQRPRVSCAYNESIYIFDRGPVYEVDRPTGNV
jgi:hypothetical protein